MSTAADTRPEGDYRSRKPTKIYDITEEEKNKLGVNNNKGIMVIKMVMDNMPTVLKVKKVEEEAKEDPTHSFPFKEAASHQIKLHHKKKKRKRAKLRCFVSKGSKIGG